MTIPKILEIGKNLPEMSARYARRKTAARIIDYVLSLGMDEINSEQEKILIESLSEDLKIDLKNRNLFKPFISNGIKINPELRNNWKIDIISLREGDHGGYKELVTSIHGKQVYKQLKFDIPVDQKLFSPNYMTRIKI